MNRPTALLWYRLIASDRLEVSRQDVIPEAVSEAMWLVRHGRGIPVLIEGFDWGERTVLDGATLDEAISDRITMHEAMEARRRADFDRQGPLLFRLEVSHPAEVDGEGGVWRHWSSHRTEREASTAGHASGLPQDRWRVVNVEDGK